MRTFFWIRVASLLLTLWGAVSLQAVSPVPYTEAVSFNLRVQGDGAASMGMTDELGTPFFTTTWTAGGSSSESAVNTAQLRPGKSYIVGFGSTGSGYNTWLSFIVPTGYGVFVDGVQTNMVAVGWQTTNGSHNYTIELRPLPLTHGPMPLGSFSGIKVGKSISWELGLGGLYGDRNPGRLIFKEHDLSNSPVSRARLYLGELSSEGSAVWSINDGPSNQTLRQVITVSGIIDLLDDAGGGYWIRFFPHSQSEGSPGNPNILHGSPWKTIRIQSPATNQLTITETEGSVSRVSQLTLTSGSISSGNYVWTLQEGNGSTWIRTTTYTSTVAGSVRTVVEEVRNGSSTLAAKTSYRYENVGGSNAEELTQIVADPDGAALATNYTYYVNSANLGNFNKVRSVTGPTGNWSAQEYYDDWDRRGQLKYSYQPYLDAPATVPTTLDPTSGLVTYFEYSADWSGRFSRPTLRQEKTNNVVTAKTTWTQGDITGGGWPHEYSYINSYRDGSNYQTDYTERYRADSWPSLAGHMVNQKGSNLTQDVWSRVAGDYNPTTGTFTSGAGISYVRDIVIHGTTSSSGAELVSSWDGHTFPAVYLIPNRSTFDAIIYSAALRLQIETWVYTGSGAFSRMSYEILSYDAVTNRLTGQKRDNNILSSNTYANGYLTSSIDAAGIENQFTYDLIGRVATTVKKGAPTYGSYAAQGDITTTYTYDGANHATQAVTSGGALALTTSSAFDLAGRQTTSTAPGSYMTGYAYSSGGKIVTTTFPGGATNINETYLGGQLKSISGTASVARYFGCTVNGTSGNVTQQVNFGTSGSTSLEKTTTDWLGRVIAQVQPGWNGTDTTTTWVFNSAGQLAKVIQPGQADTLYTYDSMGVLFRTGLDVNANGSLDVTSDDRITENGWIYFMYGSAWARRDTKSVYPQSGNGTARQVEQVDNILVNPAGRLAGVIRYDVFGNATTSVVDVSPGTKRQISTTYLPTGAYTQQIAYNGLSVSGRDPAGNITTFGYDALGRQLTSTDPRTGATTTAYVSGTSQVSTVTDPASVVQATYAYDSAGRVSSVKDALNKYAYTGYTTRNEIYRQWGDTAVPVEYGYDNWGHQTSMKTYRAGTGWTASTWPASPGTADTTTWAFHEPTGLLSSKTDATGKAVSYTYTQARQIATRQWARILTGTTHVTATYGYSSSTGELTSVGYNDTTTPLAYTYNRLGNSATVTDATGTRTFNYNLAGTLELQNEVMGTSSGAYYGDCRLSRGYDTAAGVVGRYSRLSLGSAGNPYAYYDMTYGHDGLGRINSAYVFNYTYAANSNLVQTVGVSAWGYTDTRVYDPYHDWTDDRKTQIGSTIKAEFAYTQDALGRVTQVAKTGEMFNRYGNTTQGLATSYGYDDRSQVTSDQTKLGGTSTVLTGRNDAHAYDMIGNRSTVTHNGNSATYTPNTLNQYTQRTVPGIFDVAGASSGATVTVSKSGGPTDTAARHGPYFFDGYALANTSAPAYSTLTVNDGTTSTNLPAYVPKTAQLFTYDDDGNLLSDGRWNYTYDAENRLATVETSAAAVGAGVVRQKLTFAYDYLGRRVSKLVQSGWNGSSYASTDFWHRFIYDGWNFFYEIDAANALASVRLAVWGLDQSGTLQGAGGVGGLLGIWNFSTASWFLPAYDGMGNINALISYTDGAIGAAYEYDAFGNTLRESGPYAAGNPYRFSTKYTDIETGLVYYGLRYYSPTLGRFINKDPIAERGGLNLYGFCANDSVNSWDYLGLDVPGMAPYGFGPISYGPSIPSTPTVPTIRTSFGTGVSFGGEGTAGAGIFSAHGEASVTGLVFVKIDTTNFNNPVSFDSGVVFSGAASFGPLGILSTDKFLGDGTKGMGSDMSDGFNPALGLSTGVNASLVLTDAANSQEYADMGQGYYLNSPLSLTYQEGSEHHAVSVGVGPGLGLSAGRQRATSVTGTTAKNWLSGAPAAVAQPNNSAYTPGKDTYVLDKIVINGGGKKQAKQKSTNDGGSSNGSGGSGGGTKREMPNYGHRSQAEVDADLAALDRRIWEMMGTGYQGGGIAPEHFKVEQ